MNRKPIAISIIALTCMLASFSAGNSAASAPNQKTVVGTWERVSYKDAEGKAIEDRLLHAYLIFSADGHFSQTLLPPGRDKIRKPLKEMTKEELLNRFDGVVALYGTYTIAGDKLTRTMITNIDPNSEGIEFTQIFRVEGDVLILSGAPTAKVVTPSESRFQRVK